jgi:uncharacterized integral membrane protein
MKWFTGLPILEIVIIGMVIVGMLLAILAAVVRLL